GIFWGGLVGGVIGLFVALSNAGGRGGLLIGSLAGAALAIYLVSGTSKFDDFMRTLAVIVLPAAQSMGLLAAVLTTR
ncbi:MAG TPA: hypothetical protein VN843_10965, partial [Anaerolineales bacterium]|nr:hypothetical protein [Anaerolineales bacterium]